MNYGPTLAKSMSMVGGNSKCVSTDSDQNRLRVAIATYSYACVCEEASSNMYQYVVVRIVLYNVENSDTWIRTYRTGALDTIGVCMYMWMLSLHTKFVYILS